ncbi:9479_t:CDS:2, partial [Acaulospora morrowiae]
VKMDATDEENYVKSFVNEISEGICYLHDNNIAHRDLHGKNILIHQGNIKISDFGLSKKITSYMTTTHNLVGVIPFIEPQKIMDTKYKQDQRSDIYSLGVVFWLISSRRCPFNDQSFVNISLMISKGERENPVEKTPSHYVRLYSECWDQDPEMRPSAREVLARLRSMPLVPVYDGTEESLMVTTPDFGNTELGICSKCLQQFTDHEWCQTCEVKNFRDKFTYWTSNNQELDIIIKNSQLNAKNSLRYLEWIEYDQLKDIKVLSTGHNSGLIYSAKWPGQRRKLWNSKFQQCVTEGNNNVAIRILKNSLFFHLVNANVLEIYLSCDNILNCYGFTYDKETGNYGAVMQFVDGGTLQTFLSNNSPGWNEIHYILTNIVESLQSIHELGYAHCDLNVRTISLVNYHGKCDDCINFGYDIYISNIDNCSKIDNMTNLTDVKEELTGILAYVDPHAIRGNRFSAKSDIYSLGIVMWALSSRKSPYRDKYLTSNLALEILDGWRPKIVEDIPECYAELMTQCWDKEPINRPSIERIKQALEDWKTNPDYIQQFELSNQKRMNSM